MKAFRASYHDTWSFSGFEVIEYIVVAATTDDVLEDVMKEEPNTIEKLWDINEIDTTKRSCEQTHYRSV